MHYQLFQRSTTQIITCTWRYRKYRLLFTAWYAHKVLRVVPSSRKYESLYQPPNLLRLDRRHANAHTRFACAVETCERSFTLAKDLCRHQETVHSDRSSRNIGVFTCPSCTYATRRKDHFERHELSHQRQQDVKKKKKRPIAHSQARPGVLLHADGV